MLRSPDANCVQTDNKHDYCSIVKHAVVKCLHGQRETRGSVSVKIAIQYLYVFRQQNVFFVICLDFTKLKRK